MSDKTLNLYISPIGNDNWSGMVDTPLADESDGPLATLAAARNVIRRYKSNNNGLDIPVTVQIANGFYELTETVCFSPQDSGTKIYPIRYIAAPGAKPVISGGKQITGWTETKHNNLRCWVVELPEVTESDWNFTRLYVNSEPRQRTRLPKDGFYHFTGVDGFKDTGFSWCKGPDRANFSPGDIQQWHNWEDAELISYQLWFDTHHRFKSIIESESTVHFHTKSLGSLRDERGDFARYYVENIFEALDTPGQWYLDRVTGKLYYLPLQDEKLGETTIVAPRLTEILRIQGDDNQRVRHLHFENITFAHQHWQLPLDCPGYIQAAFGVPGALILAGAESCVFYGCTIAHVNGYGIELLAGSTENIIAACGIHDTGGGGVKIGHEELVPHESPVGERMTGDYPASATTIIDCTIRDCGHIFPSAIGIWVGNSGWNRLIHNHIFNCNYTGISCGWTWGYAPTRTVCNLIEYNHIHHINHNEILSDNGGIYTLGQQPGTILRGNVIHDISCYGYGAWGIYPDEGSSEMLIEKNLVYGTKKASYSTHYGRDCIVQNNIFALSKNDHICLGKRELHRSTIFRNNIIVTANGRINGGGWDTGHYTTENNLFWSLNGTPISFNEKSLKTLQTNGQNIGSIITDPLFSDSIGGDFSLRPDSPAIQLGFTPFDWRNAGIRLTADKPLNFTDYKEIFTLPVMDSSVVRTQINLVTLPDDIQSTGKAEFVVKLVNVGRGQGNGSIKLISGPQGTADNPTINKIKFNLLPGEEYSEKVIIDVAKNAHLFWLDSEPEDAVTVPARALIFNSELCEWIVEEVSEMTNPQNIKEILSSKQIHTILNGDSIAAEVWLGANEENLLFTANFYENELKPNITQPWTGTGFEILAMLPIDPDAPVDQPRDKRQLFIIPQPNGVDCMQISDGIVPATEIISQSIQITGGYEISAIIPWHLLGYENKPKEVPFELIVDCVDKTTGEIIQVPVFDLPSDGWRKLYGKLAIK
jgi:hypothetical protein